MEKENKVLGILIMVSIAVLLGIIFTSILATENNKNTGLTTYTKTFDISSARLPSGAINNSTTFSLTEGLGSWREDVTECSTDEIISANNFLVLNATGTELDNNGCDTGGYYVVQGVNSIKFCNTFALNQSIATSNTTTITYQACSNNYVSGWAQTISNLVVGFFALAIMIIAGMVMYRLAKEEFD